MAGSLRGKTYIVTRASRGIGLATAKSIGRHGGRVALFAAVVGLRDGDAM